MSAGIGLQITSRLFLLFEIRFFFGPLPYVPSFSQSSRFFHPRFHALSMTFFSEHSFSVAVESTDKTSSTVSGIRVALICREAAPSVRQPGRQNLFWNTSLSKGFYYAPQRDMAIFLLQTAENALRTKSPVTEQYVDTIRSAIYLRFCFNPEALT